MCKRFRWVGAIALVALVLAAAPTFAEDPAEDPGKTADPSKPKAPAKEKGIGTGDLAPAWKGKTFINSDELTLEGLRGKYVFIEYFGTG